MLIKPMGEISKTDIEQLVTQVVPESLTFEYKETLPGNSDEEKKEFLADVSALANSAGGHIVYGVTEKRSDDGKTTGLPDLACGVEVENQDEVGRRLDSILRDGIQPRFPHHSWRWVPDFPKGPVLVLYVPRSWVAPHMVAFKGGTKFYGRNQSSKYVLDVSQLRTAFLLSESVTEKARQFRADRVAKVVADQIPVRFEERARVVLHALPIDSLGSTGMRDLTYLAEKSSGSLQPFSGGGYSHRFNLDGFVTFTPIPKSEHSMSYLQVFRSGPIEAASTLLISTDGEQTVIHATEIERQTISTVRQCTKHYEAWGVSPPIVLSVTLVGVMGARISGRFHFAREPLPIDRDEVFLPDVLLVDFKEPVERVLKPMFDAMWQAAGHRGSRNYDDAGNWVPKP